MQKTQFRILLYSILLFVGIGCIGSSCNSNYERERNIDETSILRLAFNLTIGNDTNNIRVLINDSLVGVPKKNDPIFFKTMETREGFAQRFSGFDTTYRAVLTILIDSVVPKSLKDLSIIKDQHKFSVSFGKVEDSPSHDSKAKYITFSNIAFNSKKTTACIYVTLNCGLMCSSTQIIFFCKKNGQWQIKGNKTLSIS